MVKCQSCKKWQWNFNLKQHYKCEHAGTQMSKTDQEVCNEIQKEFTQQHVEKIQSTKTRKKRAVKLSNPKVTVSHKKIKTMNRLSATGNVLDMLGVKRKRKSASPPRKKKKQKMAKKKKTKDVPDIDNDAPPRKRKRVQPKPKPIRLPNVRELKPPPPKRRKSDSDSDFFPSDMEESVFDKERRRRKTLPPPSPVIKKRKLSVWNHRKLR